MESIGFSDHSYTGIDNDCGIPLNDYENYHNEIDRLKEKYSSKIKVFKGIEVDSFSNENKKDYDYVIASVHYVYCKEKYYPIDINYELQLKCINECFNGNKNDYAKEYYESLINHVKSLKPNFVGHVDVITKFGLFDNDNLEYREIAKNAVKEIVKYCNVFEMNTGAIARKKRTKPYPERYLLEEIYKLGGEIVLSSDAHSIRAIDCYFNECIEILKDIGFKYILKFNGKEFYKEYF
jgi:histidinol-phosphatase (PHP family)